MLSKTSSRIKDVKFRELVRRYMSYNGGKSSYIIIYLFSNFWFIFQLPALSVRFSFFSFFFLLFFFFAFINSIEKKRFFCCCCCCIHIDCLVWLIDILWCPFGIVRIKKPARNKYTPTLTYCTHIAKPTNHPSGYHKWRKISTSTRKSNRVANNSNKHIIFYSI